MLSTLPEQTRGRGLLLTDYRLLRRRHLVAAILVTDRAILVFGTDRGRVETAAIELADFHEGCRGMPVIPVVMVDRQRVVAQRPLPLAGAAPPVLCTRLLLPGLLDGVGRLPAIAGFDAARWLEAPYRPVPGLIQAACRLYDDHDVAELSITTSGHGDLGRTREAVLKHLAAARAAARKLIVFVTGAPGAGKTLLGLDLAFEPGAEAVFLTGNPALVAVLRAALVRDAASRGLGRRAARQRVAAMLQPLHHFRDACAGTAAPPAERLLVIDEAQRCWSAQYAGRKTRNRAMPLLASEPSILLDAMARHDGFTALICLIGGGQEIHAGESGLTGWTDALASRPEWHAALPPGAGATSDAALHLGAPVRTWRAPRAVAWVEAVLANDSAAARRLVRSGLPFRLTRSLPAMQAALRLHRADRPPRRAGLLASTGARRLRAEGLGGLLWHQDEDAVAAWFLDTWPDIRSADALEVAATEFGAQGLELDHTGLCWDADLVRTPDGTAWQARAFRANTWTVPSSREALANRLNAYRVLLTRARRDTIIWVPRGDAADVTRAPTRYDAIAFYLQSCGLPLLDTAAAVIEDTEMSSGALL